MATERENLELLHSMKSGSQNISDVLNKILKNYPRLQEKSQQLEHLESRGVDNWSEYSRYDSEEEEY